MGDSSTFLQLAERCEREEPSGLLDADIAVALRIGPASVTLDHWIYRNFPNWKARPDGRVEAGMHWAPLPYTTSLDAAVTLMPKDAWKEICGPRKYLNIPSPVPNYWLCELIVGNAPPYKTVKAWAATEALALCAVALRARSALSQVESR